MAVCDLDISFNCDQCYEVSKASDALTFAVGLTPSTQYFLFVTDKFKKIYRVLITTSVTGGFTINNDDFPGTLFNKFAGTFTVFISLDANAADTETLTISAVEYGCIALKITDIGSGCEAPEPQIGPTVIITDQGVISEVDCGDEYTCTFCENSTVENSDQTFQETIAPGDTLVLADTTYNVNVNGVFNQTTIQPSMIDLTINIT